jgi:hypothetical protein
MTKAFEALKDRLAKSGCDVTDTAPGEFVAVRYSEEELIAWVEKEALYVMFDLLHGKQSIYWGS